MAARKLEPADLYKTCDLSFLDFKTTDELDPVDDVIGQPRAVDAVTFGIGIQRSGYNLFAFGPAGSGKQTLVQRQAERRAATEPLPPDWCYINNFQQSDKPHAMALPTGRGIELHEDMNLLVDELYNAIPAIFESNEYRIRAQAIEDEVNAMQDKTLKDIQNEAERRDIVIVQTATGFTLTPLRKGKRLKIEEYEKLPEEERKRIQADSNELQHQLELAVLQLPKLQKLGRDRTNRLNREMATATVSHLIDPLREKYKDLECVVRFFNEVQEDVITHFRKFNRQEEGKVNVFGVELTGKSEMSSWRNRYSVNVLVSHKGENSAPVIYEDNPSYNNLIGRVEHQSMLGTLVTDFTMIRAGALHRANGGYLILDAMKILMQPFAWEGLKRVLRAGEVRIESLAQITSLISSVSLEPESVPINVKVILLGERRTYYLLSYFDPEFRELFKVAVDFAYRMDRNEENHRAYAQLITSMIRHEKLSPFDRAAVECMIERSARLVSDSEKLATHMRSLLDLLMEADYWAQQRHTKLVERVDVEKAIAMRDYRMDQLRELIQEEIQRKTILIDTKGARIGCVNGLSLSAAGDFWFGRPSRITAAVRMGGNKVVDIEREVELGGPIHSKGVFILSAYIASHYLPNKPLSLSASLVFEQSYSGVEGDSASSAELFALLSALAKVPIRQSLAVTGSVNQQGEIQAIGGVNEKIEGFFDVCVQLGLNDEQGVIIPESNVKHLMLRKDVREAVENEKFSIYAISNVNEGIELLSNMPAGERGEDDLYNAGTFNRAVEDTLIKYAEMIRNLKKDGDQDAGEKI